MKKIYYTILQIQDAKNITKVLQLLNQHRTDVEKHIAFMHVLPSETADEQKVTTVLEPKNSMEMEAYNNGARPKKKQWFKEHLLDTGLVTVLHSGSMNITVDA